MKNNIPTFLVQGFLDAGKTTFINKTLSRDKIFEKGITLLLLCEEGEVVCDEDIFKKRNVKVVRFASVEDFSLLRLNELNNIYNPDRILIEMNFLWDVNAVAYPEWMNIIQIFTIIDGTSFPIYYQNMKQQFNNAIYNSDVVAFTKLNDDASSLQPYKRALAVTNYKAFYCLMNENCLATKEAFSSLVPYDLNQDIVEINDDDFGIFYVDSFNNREPYENKIVTFRAWVAKSQNLKPNEFIIGRKVMNCCANDIQFFGFLVVDDLNKHLKHNSWIKLTARCNNVYSEEYKEDEIVLTPIKIEEINPIEPEILNLNA